MGDDASTTVAGTAALTFYDFRPQAAMLDQAKPSQTKPSPLYSNRRFDNRGQPKVTAPASLRRFGRVLQVDVNSLIAGDGRDVGFNLPVDAGGKQLSGLR